MSAPEPSSGKICAVPPDGSAAWADGVVRMPAANVTIEGELAHAHFADDEPAPSGPKLVHDVVAVPAVAPMIATLGSMTFHGAALAPGIGSIDVFAEGKAVFRMLVDVVACPAATPLPHVGGVVAPLGPPPTVFVNGFAVARAGDAVMEPLGGPNPIMLGATTVFAGPPAPPMTSVSPVGRPAGDPRPGEPDVQARAERDAGVPGGQATGSTAASVDDASMGPELHASAASSLVRVEGEVVVELSVLAESVAAVERPVDDVVGKWKGPADMIFDPIQRRAAPAGDRGGKG
jgi:uncharacterized Zn-binding protein involved in type VI secretion